jgi:hypothetical protein
LNLLLAEMGFKKWEKPEKPDKPTPEIPWEPERPGEPQGPTPQPEEPEGPIPTETWVWSTPYSTNWEVSKGGPSQNVIPPNGEGGHVWDHVPSPDAPPASNDWAVWVWDPKPTPTNQPYDPFAPPE